MKTEWTLKILWGSLLLAGLAFPLVASAMEMEDCLGCHSEIDVVGEALLVDAVKFEHTVHAELGCATCHSSVTDEHPDDGAAVSRADCLDCHQEVGDQYMQTAHAENATCGDCHDPHQAHGLDAVSASDMNEQCSQCHENAAVVEQHSEWLPQASLHIAKLPCITCHTSSEEYKIVLHISQKQEDRALSGYEISKYEDLKVYSGAKEIKGLIDINKDNFISLAELRTFNLNPAYKALHLDGTLFPSEASHDLTTLDNRYDCSFCHASGPGSMQTSFLALPTPDGSFARIDVEEGAVLDALYGTPNFYMTGSTRSASLNIIGFIIICCGFIMPIGHGTLRFLTRKNRKH
ncbi:MAG: cytochrome c family protein [Deltaproteobacteria bacterium]|nr:cytochrome c family protein [Deltaproteobacteria bacterium]MCW9049144.1 cytochrome c family protein [Deltaproteobacteria bacterium]